MWNYKGSKGMQQIKRQIKNKTITIDYHPIPPKYQLLLNIFDMSKRKLTVYSHLELYQSFLFTYFVQVILFFFYMKEEQ